MKKIVIVEGKLTKSRVLQGGARICGAPRGGDGVEKFSLSCGAGAGAKTPSFKPAPPRPIVILNHHHQCETPIGRRTKKLATPPQISHNTNTNPANNIELSTIKNNKF